MRKVQHPAKATVVGDTSEEAQQLVDEGRDMTARLQIGVFVTPDATDPERTLAQLVAADQADLDVVGVQDHPYQRRFFDTWTLLSYVAARTERVRLVPDVASLPLRPPAMLAKAAASLDVLSGGRVELGLGAGTFWDAIEAMGGPRRSPGAAVEALEEAIAVLRGWFRGERSMHLDGRHYRVVGARSGPPPAHPIGLWIGGYKPRMLRLTGRLGDGWLPTVGYLDLSDAHSSHRVIDEAARRAGRDPGDVRRVLNAGVEGPTNTWAGQLARLTADYRFDTVLVTVPDEDPVGFIHRLGEDAAPAARAEVG